MHAHERRLRLRKGCRWSTLPATQGQQTVEALLLLREREALRRESTGELVASTAGGPENSTLCISGNDFY